MCKKWIFYIVILATFLGCAGYQFKKNTNPLKIYGIESVSIPMFINRSVYPNVSGLFTKEVITFLSFYPELKVYSGEDSRADAVLIGIIDSNKRLSESTEVVIQKFSENELQESIGDRQKLYIPSTGSYSLSIRLILIKNPNWSVVKLAKSNLAPHLKGNPSIIFNEIFNIKEEFNYIVNETKDIDSSGFYNFTRTKHSFEKAIKISVNKFIDQVKGTFLDVF